MASWRARALITVPSMPIVSEVARSIPCPAPCWPRQMLPPPIMTASSTPSSAWESAISFAMRRTVAASIVSSLAELASASPDSLSTARRQRGWRRSPEAGAGTATSASRAQAPTTTCAKRRTSAGPRSCAIVRFSSFAYGCSSRTRSLNHPLRRPSMIFGSCASGFPSLRAMAVMVSRSAATASSGTSSRRRYSGRAKAMCTATSCASSALPPASSEATKRACSPTAMFSLRRTLSSSTASENRPRASSPSVASASARLSTRATKSADLATKSVSHSSATTAPRRPWSVTTTETAPSARSRPSRRDAPASPCSRSQRRAFSKSPSASCRARRTSRIPAPVAWRSAWISLALIVAIASGLLDRREGDRSRWRRSRGRLQVLGGAPRGDEAPLEHGVGHDAAHQPARPDRVVVARYDVVDHVGVAVRVDHRDHGDAQLVRLGDRDVLLLRVDDEDRVREPLQVADAAEVALELRQLTSERERLLLREGVELAGTPGRLELDELAHPRRDGLEVREHPAQPALVHVRHAAGGGELGDGVLGLLLRADEQQRPAVGDEVAHERVGHLEERERLARSMMKIPLRSP